MYISGNNRNISAVKKIFYTFLHCAVFQSSTLLKLPRLEIKNENIYPNSRAKWWGVLVCIPGQKTF